MGTYIEELIRFLYNTNILAIAVASMNNIFIYKNMKPYFKYTLPTMELNQVEKEAWIQSRDDKFDPDMLYDVLSNLNSENSSVPLSQRSKTFLKIPRGSEESLQFLEKHQNSALTRHSSIVAMASMKKNINDENGLSILIVATEEKELLFLDVEAFTILKKIQLPSVAVFIGTNGLFDVEFQVSIISRDGHCYTMNRDTEIPKDLFSMKTHSVGLIHQVRIQTKSQHLIPKYILGKIYIHCQYRCNISFLFNKRPCQFYQKFSIKSNVHRTNVYKIKGNVLGQLRRFLSLSISS